MKNKKFLFGIAVVLLMVTSVLPGCNNEEPLVEADKLVIPPSMSPYEVSEEIFPEYPAFPQLHKLGSSGGSKHLS